MARALPVVSDYDFDEEAEGFGEPEETPPPPPLSVIEKVALALVGIGFLSMLLQIFGSSLNGTWTGFLSSFGLLAVGASITFWAEHAGSSKGIKHDGTWFRGLLARGAAGWVAGVAMTTLYVLIYWFPQALGHSPDGEPTGLVRVVDPLARARERQGAIVLVASTSSFIATPGQPGYGASKGALLTITRSLAQAWAKRGIRVNGVAPGFVKTRLTRRSHEDPAVYEETLARIPLGRWGLAQEMGDAALFLASPMASYITGQTLLVDGGITLM